MKESIKNGIKKVKELIIIIMEINIMEILLMIEQKAKEYIIIKMAINMKVNLRMIKRMQRHFLL